jgi:tetratricopeptide (TPR) repeat protein
MALELDKKVHVIPAEAGIQCLWLSVRRWIPAFAGMTLTLCLAGPTHAEQYKSEVFDAPAPAAKTPEETTNPYGKAVILQQQANQAISQKDYNRALGLIEQALKLDALSGPAAEQMRFTQAQIQIGAGQYPKAVAALEPAVRAAEAGGKKASADTYIALGAAYAGMKQYDKALPMIQKAIAGTRNPPADWLQLQLAVQCRLGKADCAGAQAQMVDKNPNDKAGWLRLSGLHLRAGDLPRALAAMELAWQQNLLTQPSELQNLAKLYIAAGSPYQAATLLDRWMQEGKLDKSAANWELAGIAWLRARESEQALSALTQAAQLGNRGDLYLQVGQLQADRENWPAAATALTQALQKGGFKIPRGQVYLALGHAYFQQGEQDKAKQAFASAAKQGGGDAAAQWLAYLDPQGMAQAMEIAMTGGAASSGPVQIEPVAIDLPSFTASLSPSTAGDGAPAAAIPASADGLTPVGATQSGNADGTIPAWTGGITPDRWPAGFARGQRLKNPYPDDKPLFVITAANAAQYRDKLSAAHQTLLARYPSYRMPVYPTRRSASFPPAIYDATQRNQGKAKLTGSDSLTGAKLGFPFRKPESGVEIMWNHRTRYRGDSVVARSTQVVVQPSGQFSDRLDLTERVLFRYGNIRNPVDIMQENILLYYIGHYSNRGNQSITVLAHETADSVKNPRNIWVIPPGLRRMFRIPPVGYDQPFIGSGGMYFVDMIDMYNGAFDRYVWKLLGKREFIIPYNAYRISDGSYKYEQLLTPKHFNPEATRYELHRVWVIEATERTGKKHSFGKRMFYVDEDSWTVVMVDNHDREGRPWRFQEGHLVARYDSQSPFCTPVVTYDLKDGRYFASGLTAESPPPEFDVKMDKGDFAPAVVGARYIH